MQKYHTLLIDLWGVIHDGSKLYPGVLQKLQQMRELGTKICFISNAPRRASKARGVLNNLGITDDLFDAIITSGECFYQNANSIMSQKSKNIFYIGPQKDLDVLTGLDYHFVKNPADAGFGIITGFTEGMEETKIDAILHLCKDVNLELFCLNPDMIVVRQDGSSELCAGVIGQNYTNIGGLTKYFGKPHLDIYEHALKLLGLNDTEKSRILAIGDSMSTDIAGANAFGIDSCFCECGIHSHQLQSMGKEAFFAKYAQKPTISIANFASF